MTPIAGFFLAVIAGWIVREPRRAAATVVLPYLAIVAVQTWGLANGYGINPPDTVTPLSGAISYYVVQLVFGLTTVAIAAELAVVRRYAAARRGEPADSPATSWHQTALAAASCGPATTSWPPSRRLTPPRPSATSGQGSRRSCTTRSATRSA